MINLDGYQKSLNRWQNEQLGEMTDQQIALGMAEEVGEICHLILKRSQNIREGHTLSDKEFREEVADGVADTLVFGLQLLTIYGVEAEDTMVSVFEKVLSRNWNKDRAGVTHT